MCIFLNLEVCHAPLSLAKLITGHDYVLQDYVEHEH